MKEKNLIKTLIGKVQSELEAVEYEGLQTPDYWYADDRIATIRNICDEYLALFPEKEKQ